ncbi:hypothetical protein NDU88_001392 [Pleurodeles waltl]|uniref:Uncharacterized protein n=1 Tax=Pleurodeles waltl TaxID=8319 RepID=A0AAV7TJJ6_PLEWA|nr:hypothetical protein NDU88_001392 [Pleurodeles waltl]
MEQDPKILEAVALLRHACRLDLLVEGALAPERPARRASAGVAAAVAACSPPRSSGGRKGAHFEPLAERDPKVPVSKKWPTMLQWSSEEEGGSSPGGKWYEDGAPEDSSLGAYWKAGREVSQEWGVLGLGEGSGEEGSGGRGVQAIIVSGLLVRPPAHQTLFGRGHWSTRMTTQASRTRLECEGGRAASRMASPGRSRRCLGAADAYAGRSGGEGRAPPVAAARGERRLGSSRRRTTDRGKYSGCARCGDSGVSAVGREEGSDESLEEGELINSGSEDEWWKRGRRGTSNPVRQSLQVQRSGTRQGERRRERKGGEARTVQERPPLLSPDSLNGILVLKRGISTSSGDAKQSYYGSCKLRVRFLKV